MPYLVYKKCKSLQTLRSLWTFFENKIQGENFIVLLNNFSGPNQIATASSYMVTDVNENVLLRIPQSGKAIETTKPISVPGLLKTSAAEFSNYPALAFKNNKKWETITYK